MHEVARRRGQLSVLAQSTLTPTVIQQHLNFRASTKRTGTVNLDATCCFKPAPEFQGPQEGGCLMHSFSPSCRCSMTGTAATSAEAAHACDTAQPPGC